MHNEQDKVTGQEPHSAGSVPFIRFYGNSDKSSAYVMPTGVKYFIHYFIPCKIGVLLCPFEGWENWGLKILSTIPKIHQPERYRTKIQTKSGHQDLAVSLFTVL